MQRSSSRPKGMIHALAKPAWGAVWLVTGMLAPSAEALAAGPSEAKPPPKIDCSSVPAGAPLPAECRKAGPDADGDRIPDAMDRCAGAPEDIDGFEDEDGCPDPDNDGDGALDEEDGCPLEAEDRDGFKDADGCPEPDNDGDGVLDVRDLCPLEAESFDGSGDGDGCPAILMVTQRLEPEPPPQEHAHAPERPPTMPVMPPRPPAAAVHATAAGRATVAGHAAAAGHIAASAAPPHATAATANSGQGKLAARSTLAPARGTPCPDGTTATAESGCRGSIDSQLIEISDTVQFAHRAETLLQASLPVLEQVVDILDENPNLRVMIVGHADGRGDEQSNLRLSMMRAVSVRSYLLQQSRDPRSLARRLEAVGIGARQPLGNNASAVGRSRNRRVEFLVVDREAGDHGAPAAHAPAHAPAPAHSPAATNTPPHH